MAVIESHPLRHIMMFIFNYLNYSCSFCTSGVPNQRGADNTQTQKPASPARSAMNSPSTGLPAGPIGRGSGPVIEIGGDGTGTGQAADVASAALAA